MVPHLFSGYNITCMAYGITGAGKTHTMLGSKGGQPGLSVMAIDAIFSLLGESDLEGYQNRVSMSYLEVYNENVKDLLSAQAQSLVIVEDPEKGIVVPGLKEAPVQSAENALEIILAGNEKRTMASTRSNEFSSRSHAIVQIHLERIPPKGQNKPLISSKLSIVDLAGSEKEVVAVH
jgi:kinesin family protein 18/19